MSEGVFDAVLDVRHELVAALARDLALHVGRIGAEDRVLAEQRQRLDLLALLLQVVEEVEHRRREHLVVRAGPEDVLEAAARQARRGIVGRHVGHLVALGRLADRGRDRALVGADEGRHLVLRDEALGLGAALLRVGLVVGRDDLQLRAAEARQARSLGERQLEVRDAGC